MKDKSNLKKQNGDSRPNYAKKQSLEPNAKKK